MSSEEVNHPADDSRWLRPRSDESTEHAFGSNGQTEIPIYGSMPDPFPDVPIASPFDQPAARPPMPNVNPQMSAPTQPAPPPTLSPPSTGTPPSVPDYLEPPGSPVAPPLLSGAYGTHEPFAPPATTNGGGRKTWIAAVLGVVALLVGGGFFALSALGASGGGATPEEAIDKMIAAINDEDFLALGEMIEPGERRTVVEPTLSEIMPELKRLGVFSDDLDMSGVDGLDFELTNVQYRIENVAGHADVAHAVLTGGTSSATFTADEFPFGENIRDRFGADMQDSGPDPESIDSDGSPIVLVEREGRWYVSMWYTMAEAARTDFGADMPALSSQPAALGADSPEAAVEQLLTQIVDFDLESVIGTLDPEEASALYRYSPIFLDDAQRALDDAKRSLTDGGAEWSISNMQFEVNTDGDDAEVTIVGFTFEASSNEFDLRLVWALDNITFSFDASNGRQEVDVEVVITPDRWTFDARFDDETITAEVDIDRDNLVLSLTGEASGEPFSGQFRIDEDGNCSQYSFDGFDESRSGCLEDGLDGDLFEADFFVSTFSGWFDGLPDEFRGPTVAAHKTDGDWYVSPTTTVMNGVVEALRELDQESFDEFLDTLESGGPAILGPGIDPFNMAGFAGAGVFGSDGFEPIDDFQMDDFPTDDFGFTTETFFIEREIGPVGHEGDLGEFETHIYEIGLEQGETVGVTLNGSPGVFGGISDPVLNVIGPDGGLVAYNDDFEGLDSGVQFTATTTGVYQIEARDLSFGAGAYLLMMEVVQAGETPTIAEGADSSLPFPDQSTTIGDMADIVVSTGAPTVLGDSLIERQYDLWTFEVPDPGQTVTITLTSDSPGFDPQLVVLDAATGTQVAENDDSGDPDLGVLDSRVVVGGLDSYSVEVHTLGDWGSGDYVLTIELG